MKQSEKLMQLLELMQANPELPVIPCVDGDVVGGDEYYCWLGSWGESAVQEFIIGKERTYYREDDICEMNDVLYAPFPRTSKRKSRAFSAQRRRRLRPSSTSSPPKEDRNGKELCM